jgi:3-hydroxyacyl-CoA dehydrogenase/3a,7a,12a-trihydroxy-5b-cholest-24-enoyl-CoA hydratase
LEFNDRVAVVTGAGGGLGRAHAKLLAARGARVVVNDLGTSASGSGSDRSSAETVASEIRDAGGRAVSDTHSVGDGDKIIAHAMDVYGRVDIVVNNAGFLRDVAFHKMSDADWTDLYNVHMYGLFKVTRAAWPHMRDKGYGRIVNTASAAGIYGNFGQVNYATFKLGTHGFTQALAIEGRAKNIHANTIAPAADSRLTRTVMTPEQLRPMRAELVSPLVAYLAHDGCRESGSLFEVGGGWIGKLRWERTMGLQLGGEHGHTPEDVAEAWAQICDFAGATHPGSMQEAMEPFSKIMGPA